MRVWKVGELARRTGITVRTLHHYEEIGLLVPSRRSAAGYRLYMEDDIARLQQIVSLRHLGLTLDEVRSHLADPEFTPLRAVELHLAHLDERIEEQQRLRARLESLAAHLRSAERVPAEELIRTMEMITMFEKYYTPEQLAELEERRKSVGEERLREVEAEWPRLMAEVRAEMERGTAPADPRVQALAARWTGLVEEFTGGNPAIAGSLRTMYEQETNVAGIDTAQIRELGAYVARAVEAARRQ